MTDLLNQYEIWCELNGKRDATIAEKLKLSMAKSTLARHGYKFPENGWMLKSEKEKLERKVRSLSWDLENKDSLIKALHDIADTFREFEDRRKGDYIERLYLRNKVGEEPETQQSEPEKPTEPESKPPVQDTPKPTPPTPKPPIQNVPKPAAPTPKPPVQSVPKPAAPTPKPPVQDTPKQDEPVQKPPEQNKSRGMKRR